ncbi:MAG: ABC transporter permease subunit [Fimbriiglobus sp.]
MSLPTAIRTTRWMIRDTFRQSVSTKLAWVMLTITLVSTVFCLSVSVEGDDRPDPARDYPGLLTMEEATRIGREAAKREGIENLSDEDARKLGLEVAKKDGLPIVAGKVSLGFGMIEVPMGRHREDSVRHIMLILVGFVGDTLGVILALLWTAGFLPTFLEPQAATVLLAKPTSRWSILLGKYLGVTLFVGLNAALFILGTWTALGLKTNVWYGAYWLAVPLLIVNFGIFYAVSAFLAVWTRSAVACTFGTLLFWVICWVINYTHHFIAVNPIAGMAGSSFHFLDFAYWFLPKPFDLGGIFFDALQSQDLAVKSPELRTLQEAGRFRPEASVAASLTFAAGTLALAAYEFEKMDY